MEAAHDSPPDPRCPKGKGLMMSVWLLPSSRVDASSAAAPAVGAADGVRCDVEPAVGQCCVMALGGADGQRELTFDTFSG